MKESISKEVKEAVLKSLEQHKEEEKKKEEKEATESDYTPQTKTGAHYKDSAHRTQTQNK